MRDLDAELRDLGVDWPATPDLATSVRAHLEIAPVDPRARRRRARRRLARPALVAAVALALLAGTAIALDVFGLRGATVKRGPVTASPTPRSGLGNDLGLGKALDGARDAIPAALRVRLPASLGAPDATYLDAGAPGARLSYVFRERAGIPRATETGVALLVTVLRGSFTPAIEKTASQAVDVERLTVDGQPAARLSGASHGFAYVSESREFAYEPQRLAATTLLVERGDLLVRIEGRLSRDRAVALARRITPLR